jgi:hypothetical protein
MGQEDDLEGASSGSGTQPPSIHKGIALGKVAMEAVEARLKRDPQLPKYDIVINPASTF